LSLSMREVVVLLAMGIVYVSCPIWRCGVGQIAVGGEELSFPAMLHVQKVALVFPVCRVP
jgi:hypothetical protein